LILTFKKATQYISFREEGKRSVTQRLQIHVHITLCSLCKLFQQQTGFITNNEVLAHDYSNESMCKEKKKEMDKHIKEITKGK